MLRETYKLKKLKQQEISEQIEGATSYDVNDLTEEKEDSRE